MGICSKEKVPSISSINRIIRDAKKKETNNHNIESGKLDNSNIILNETHNNAPGSVSFINPASHDSTRYGSEGNWNFSPNISQSLQNTPNQFVCIQPQQYGSSINSSMANVCQTPCPINYIEANCRYNAPNIINFPMIPKDINFYVFGNSNFDFYSQNSILQNQYMNNINPFFSHPSPSLSAQYLPIKTNNEELKSYMSFANYPCVQTNNNFVYLPQINETPKQDIFQLCDSNGNVYDINHAYTSFLPGINHHTI
ncbi:hypothetical protein HZS_680 [Henneguya salminicola]|nr:hypothetical protein HZS_680 [Henneguya salminicola]